MYQNDTFYFSWISISFRLSKVKRRKILAMKVFGLLAVLCGGPAFGHSYDIRWFGACGVNDIFLFLIKRPLCSFFSRIFCLVSATVLILISGPLLVVLVALTALVG